MRYHQMAQRIMVLPATDPNPPGKPYRWTDTYCFLESLQASNTLEAIVTWTVSLNHMRLNVAWEIITINQNINMSEYLNSGNTGGIGRMEALD